MASIDNPEIREVKVDFHWKCPKCNHKEQAFLKDLSVWCTCKAEMLLLKGLK